MSRLLAAVGLAAAVLLGGAPPAAAGLLPSPPPLLPSPGQPLPLPSLPVPGTVGQVVSGVTGAAPPLRPAASDQAPPGQPAPAEAPPSAPAAAAEQAALPAEPERATLEDQQARLAGAAAGLDQQAQAAAGGDGTFGWPVAFARRPPPITQGFGCTSLEGEPYSPDCVSHRFHTGIDLEVPAGTPVLASAPGVAHVVRSDRGYGNHVLVAHGGGWFTLYGHLSELAVGDGQVVGRGEPVGRSGSTGFSTGPHLHFEVRYGQAPVDPCVYLRC